MTLDLRWNRLGSTGGKGILKGLNANRGLQILELAGNKVSDDILRQVNDLLVRNKNGEFTKSIVGGGHKTASQSPFKSYDPIVTKTADAFFSPSKR